MGSSGSKISTGPPSVRVSIPPAMITRPSGSNTELTLSRGTLRLGSACQPGFGTDKPFGRLLIAVVEAGLDIKIFEFFETVRRTGGDVPQKSSVDCQPSP